MAHKPSTASKTPHPAPAKPAPQPQEPEHEGATEAQTGDRTGPAAGYDIQPAQVKDKGGVS